MKAKKKSCPTKVLLNPACGQKHGWGYDPVFKRSVLLYTEQKGIRDASVRFNLPEITIRRWKRITNEIMEKAQTTSRTRRSQRVTGQRDYGDSSGEKGNSSEDMIVDISNDIDSMPLEKRLSQNHNELPVAVQETCLQSQSISPTKLKVTRQGRLNVPSPQTAQLQPEVCLKWNTQHSHMQSVFPSLLMKEQYVDATLVSEGKTMKCHRMVLSMCSPYFEEILNGIGPFQHPVLFMKDVPFWILKSLCDFMYAGEIRILQDQLDELLNVATLLKIKGLAGTPESAEQIKLITPKIKQESESFSRLYDKALNLEEEEPPPPTPARSLSPKLLGRGSRNHDSARSSKYKEPSRDETIKSLRPSFFLRRREEKKTRLGMSLKDKDKAIEEIVPQNQQAKVPSNSKRSIKPSTSRPAHNSRRKNKIEIDDTKEKDAEKEKPPLKKDNINDPLDLLQPVYEEIAKEDEGPVMVKNVVSGRLKERGNVPVRKGVGRKIRKRRYTEYKEDADDSSPTPFQSRKGTRSRPNVKVPKFFHTQYDDSPKDSTDATIVREPHTDQDDPLIDEVGEIKVEPVDVEENTLSWTPSDQEEEIMGNYDSPLVNFAKRNSPNTFNKGLEAQSNMINPESGVINIKQGNLQLVDINQFSKGMDKPIINFNPMESPREDKSGFMITNIQSMADISEEPRSSDKGLGETMEAVQSPEKAQEKSMDITEIQKVIGCLAVKPLKLLTQDFRESGTSGATIETQDFRESDTSGATIHPNGEAILPQLEADPLAQIGGQEASHETVALEINDSEGTQIKEAADTGQDISVLEIESVEMAGDNTVQTQSETYEEEIVLSEAAVLGSQDLVYEAVPEQIEEVEKNDNTALQMEETQTLVEKGEASEEFASPAITIKLKESLETEKCVSEKLENVKSSVEASCLIEKIEVMCDDLTNPTIIDSSQETRENAVADSNNGDNLAAPSEEIVKLPNEVTSQLDNENLEPQAPVLPIETFNSKYIDPDNIDSVPPSPELKNETDDAQNIVEDIVDSNLDISPEREAGEVSRHAVENVEAESNKSVSEEQKIDNVENVAVLIQNKSESDTSNEAELEQCLASTSTTPTFPKISVKKLSFNVQPLPIEDNEDFTKDIEFGNFTPGNRPANYLEDCESDFDMEEADFKESASKEPKNDQETVVLDYKTEETSDEKEQATMELEELPLIIEVPDIALNLETESILVQENLASNSLTPLDSLEVDLSMEESLLADLDEDIEMEEAKTSQIEEDDGTEKTLEMIVNDLNESLGEMRQ